MKGGKEKGLKVINGRIYKATSPDILLLPFLSVGDNTTYTLPTRMAHHIQQKLAEYNRKYLLPSATSLDKKDGEDENRPIPDPSEQILSNVDELVTLTGECRETGQQKASSRLQSYTRVYSNGEDLILLLENEKRIIKIYKLPYKGLIGLVKTQIQLVHTNILLESMYLNPRQGPSEKQYSSKSFEHTKLNQLPKYIPKYIKAVSKQGSIPLGSDDFTIPEELEKKKRNLSLKQH